VLSDSKAVGGEPANGSARSYLRFSTCSTYEAASRVNAVGRAYERLAYTADYENIDLIEYLRQIIKTSSQRSRLAKSSLLPPKQFGLRRIVRFLSGLSSTSSSQMQESMLIQIVPAA